MSLRSYNEAASREASTAMAAFEDQSRSVGAEVSPGSGAWQGLADFNPLMLRVMRAQQLAEGRRYRIGTTE